MAKDGISLKAATGCIRIPFLAHGPSFEGGRTPSGLVSLIDVPTTILRAAGITPPREMKGRALQDLIHETGAWRGEVFLQISESHCGRAIRTHNWKYSVRAPDKTGHDPDSKFYVEDFLYDLSNDPHELNNLVTDPRYNEIRTDLQTSLKRCMVNAGEKPPRIATCDKH